MPFAANAAGLGKLTVFSGLGEPLSAEIELSASKEELSSIAARIAPNETYTEQGLERTAGLGALKLDVVTQAGGASVIKLSTVQPVNDPFLDMLIQIEWSTGRLLREYTALLDPPGYGDQKAVNAAPPKLPSTQTSKPSVDTSSVRKALKGRKPQATSSTTTTTTESAPADVATSGEGYATKSGDTLSGVARQLQVEGVSLEQMLAGLYDANKDAFIDGNMNRLKVGQIIRTPDADALKAISQQDAAKEIHVHSRDWHAYRNKLASAVAESSPEGEGAQGQSASGKITAPAEDKAAVAPTGPRDVVKLSKSESGAAKPGTQEAATSKQNASKEDAIARDKAAKEADERIALLEKQLQETQKLLQIKNQGMADAQKGKPAADQPKPPVPAPAPAVTPPPAPVPAPAAETKPVETSKPAEPVAEPKPHKKPKRVAPPPVPEPAPEPDLLADPMLLAGVGGGLLALLGGGWLYLRNKRRKSLDSFEQGILTTSGLKPNTVFGNTAGGLVDTGDTSFLTDLSQGSGGMIDTNDVDPIAEAEVYMAYGRDVQAEEILKDAITKEPKRYELHQKLLEIYANRKDTTAFETLAGELYATLGAADPNWQKFAAMGHALEPTNPLYTADVSSVPATEDRLSETQEFSSAVFNTPEPEAAVALDNPDGFMSLGQNTNLEFDEPAEAQEDSLDFDLGIDAESPKLDTLEEAAPQEAESISPELEGAEAPTSSSNADDNSLDFSFDLPEPASPESVQLEAAEIGLEEATGESLQDTVTLEAMPELSVVDTTEAAEPAATTAEEDISFDLPDFDFAPSVEPTSVVADEAAVESLVSEQVASDETLSLPEPDEISFELPEETPAVAEDILQPSENSTVEPEAEEIVFEATPDEENALDFDFAIDEGGESQIEIPADTAALGLPDLNLSGISLDLDEPSVAVEETTQAVEAALPTPEALEEVEEITFSADESADVDTKLDLVAAYTDMGDTEGARELLEEVLREGGPQQRTRAQSLLDGLG